MEFSVSKSDLVRELGLTQGVVEKKTTIPILSNILVETDHDQVWLTQRTWNSVSAAHVPLA
jgi:DNA polymerase-3 subunit beta